MSAHPARHLQDALHHTRLVPAGSSAATPASCDLLALQRLFMMSPPPPLPPHPPPPPPAILTYIVRGSLIGTGGQSLFDEGAGEVAPRGRVSRAVPGTAAVHAVCCVAGQGVAWRGQACMAAFVLCNAGGQRNTVTTRLPGPPSSPYTPTPTRPHPHTHHRHHPTLRPAAEALCVRPWLLPERPFLRLHRQGDQLAGLGAGQRPPAGQHPQVRSPVHPHCTNITRLGSLAHQRTVLRCHAGAGCIACRCLSALRRLAAAWAACSLAALGAADPAPLSHLAARGPASRPSQALSCPLWGC